MWRVEDQQGVEALSSVTDEWHRLEASCRTATPFQSPEWLIPWWVCFAHDELRVITVRRANNLCAVLPLVTESKPDGRRVTLLGTGNTDHLDLVVDDRWRDVATAMAMNALAELLTARDWCDFEQLPEWSALLTTPAPSGWRWETERCDVCPVLAISGCAADDPLPPQRSADARRARRRLSRRAHWQIGAVARDTLDEVLSALFDLHQARWQAHSHPGVLGTEAVRRFLRCAARGLADRGMLRAYALKLDGRIVGVHLGFQGRRRRFFYISGFDPALKSLSIGTVLLEQAIRDAASEGVSEIDFLRGSESYKYHWGASDRPSYRRSLRRAPG